jgi:hypothetical protein
LLKIDISKHQQGAMQEITKQSVLKSFQEEKTLSWDDFSETKIFFDIGQEGGKSTQLRNALADLIKEGLIMPVHGILPACGHGRKFFYFSGHAIFI